MLFFLTFFHFHFIRFKSILILFKSLKLTVLILVFIKKKVSLIPDDIQRNNFKEPRNRIQGMDSANLFSLVGWYVNCWAMKIETFLVRLHTCRFFFFLFLLSLHEPCFSLPCLFTISLSLFSFYLSFVFNFLRCFCLLSFSVTSYASHPSPQNVP
jgi:hypothetical protein